MSWHTNRYTRFVGGVGIIREVMMDIYTWTVIGKKQSYVLAH